MLKRMVILACALLLALAPAAARGEITTRATTDVNNGRHYNATEFVGEAPDELAQAFAHPKLEGWDLLCGALWTLDEPGMKGDIPDDYGFAAFGRGDERQLVMLHCGSADKPWSLSPVGDKALLKGRDLSIVCVDDDRSFSIVYPVSAKESERFGITIQRTAAEDWFLCRLLEYRRVNEETSDAVLIDNRDMEGRSTDAWYRVIVYEKGRAVKAEQYPAYVSGFLDHIDADAFPKTAEACAAVKGYTVPEGYGVSCGVHLRKSTSSRSADLGLFNQSATRGRGCMCAAGCWRAT